MNFLVFCLLSFGIACSADEYPTRELINNQVDWLVDFFRKGFELEKSEFVSWPDMNFGDVSMSGVQFGDVKTFQRAGDVFRIEPSVDTMTIQGLFNFTKFEIKADRLTYKQNQASAPVLVKMGPNSIYVRYTMYHKSKRECTTSWEEFTVNGGEVEVISQDLKFNGEFTGELKDKMIQQFNDFFKTKVGLKLLGSQLDFCIRFPF